MGWGFWRVIDQETRKNRRFLDADSKLAYRPVDPTSPIVDNTVMRRRVMVSPILVAICLSAQPRAADEKGIDFFENKISGT